MPTLSDALPKHAAAGEPTNIRRSVSVDWKLLDEVLEATSRETHSPESRRAAAVELVARLLSADYAAWFDLSPDGEWRCEHERCSVADELADLRIAAFAAISKFSDTPRSESTVIDDQRQIVLNQIPFP